MEVFICHQPLEEEGEERQAGSAHADGVRRHSALEQPCWQVPIDVALDDQQGVALIVVLPPEQCYHPSARVHRVSDQGVLGAMEEVGHPKEGQEEDLGPYRRHPHLDRERPKGVWHHRSLPHEEGGAVDDAQAPTIRDGAQGITRRNGAHRGKCSQTPRSCNLSRRRWSLYGTM
jgi:hypothetical protein